MEQEMEFEAQTRKRFEKFMQMHTIQEIYAHLNDNVIGQDAAKKALSVVIYNHYKRFYCSNGFVSLKGTVWEKFEDVVIEKSNILLTGPTGTGKTYLVKNICNLLGIPCYIADCTKLTESGFVGADVESILTGLLHEAGGDVNMAECGICILDEIDKIGRRGENPSLTRDVGGEGVQQGLLKIIEGNKVGISPQGGRIHPEQKLITFNTTNVLFIGLGAFVGLDKIIEKRCSSSSVIGYAKPKTMVNEGKTEWLDRTTPEDLKKFGMIPELIGRFPIITHTSALNEEDLCKILTEPHNSIIKQYQKIMAFDNIELTFDDDALKLIAHIALKNDTGARGLRGIIDKVLLDVMFKHCSGVNTELIQLKVGKDMVLEALKDIYAED